MSKLIIVKATFDDEAGVWWTESSDLPGLRIEAETFEALQARLPGATLDLLEERGATDDHTAFDVPVELIAHASSKVRIGESA